MNTEPILGFMEDFQKEEMPELGHGEVASQVESYEKRDKERRGIEKELVVVFRYPDGFYVLCMCYYWIITCVAKDAQRTRGPRLAPSCSLSSLSPTISLDPP